MSSSNAPNFITSAFYTTIQSLPVQVELKRSPEKEAQVKNGHRKQSQYNKIAKKNNTHVTKKFQAQAKAKQDKKKSP